MIKKTVPVFESTWDAYTQGFEGVAWCLDNERLVEVWMDGSWELLPPSRYSEFVDWSSVNES